MKKLIKKLVLVTIGVVIGRVVRSIVQVILSNQDHRLDIESIKIHSINAADLTPGLFQVQLKHRI